jgi:peptidoglycan/LPS O-acetylase OafA/YrhL
VPGVFTWLGQISYSLYLLHAIVLFLIPRAVPDIGTQTPAIRAAAALAYLIAVLGLAGASYRIVELPGQALGRRLITGRAPRPAPGPHLATQRAAPGTGRGENARESV